MKQLLKQTITISRATTASGANMGVETTPLAVYEGIGASVQPATSSIMLFYAQRNIKVTQTVFVAGTLDLQRGDTVAVDGRTLQVIGWRDLTGRGRVMAIDCEEFPQ